MSLVQFGNAKLKTKGAKFMESVVSIVFKVESEAYQALTELRRQPVSDQYIVSQAALVKKKDGRIAVEDAFDTGVETNNDTVIGGLIGGLVGILGGPLGMLMTGSLGALTGSIIDAGDAAHNASLLEKVSEQFVDGEVAIIALAQETEPNALDGKLSAFQATIVREDAAEVAEEVRRAEEIQAEMRKEARKKLREEKKADFKQKIADGQAKIKADFEELKKKLSRQN